MYEYRRGCWPMAMIFVGATAAASAIGFINMIGNLGGSVGSMVVGEVSQGQASFANSLWLLAPWPFAAALIILIVGYSRRRASRLSPDNRVKAGSIPAGDYGQERMSEGDLP